MKSLLAWLLLLFCTDSVSAQNYKIFFNGRDDSTHVYNNDTLTIELKGDTTNLKGMVVWLARKHRAINKQIITGFYFELAPLWRIFPGDRLVVCPLSKNDESIEPPTNFYFITN